MTTENSHETLASEAATAVNAGDIEALVRMMHPDFVVFSSPELANPGTFHGEEGFRRWLGDWLDAWETFAIEIERLETLDERFAIAHVRQTGRGKGSGLEIDMNVAQLWEIEDGKIRRFELHPTVEAAHEAAERLRLGG